MDAIVREFRYAARRLRQAPAFTLVIILTLALGIGANTAIFSVVNAVLLRPLPFAEPERLVTIEHLYPSLNRLQAPVSVPGFRDYRERLQSYERMAVQTWWMPNLTGTGDPERVTATRVTGTWFATLGVAPALGRALAPDDAEAGRDKVVVLSHGFWQRAFGGGRDAIGKSVVLDGERYEIVGVMPRDFRDFFHRPAELWAPLVFEPAQFDDSRRTNEWLALTARLKPGAGAASAQAELTAFAATLKQQYPDNYPPDWSLLLTTFDARHTGALRPTLLVLLGAVGFVLLIACANVANLLLARGAARLKEVAVRTALGASGWQLARQLLAESVLLALLGGVLGLVLAFGGVRAIGALELGQSALPDRTGIDLTVLAFTLLVSGLTGLLFGLAPVVQAVRASVHEMLKEGGRTGTGDRSGLRIRRALVVAEVALALTLLTGAGLLIKSVMRLQGVTPGFEPDRLLTFALALPETRYPRDTQQIAFFDRALPAVAAVPGVRAVGATSVLPFGGGWRTGSFQIDGYQAPEGQPSPWGDIRVVSPAFFGTMGIALRKGRVFAESDGPGAPRVAVVDEELARRYFPNGEAVGRRVYFGAPAGQAPRYIEIVGVVAHTMHERLDADARIQLYLPYRQVGTANLSFTVRAAGDPLALVPAVRAAVRTIDRDQPLSQIRAMDDLLDASIGSRRLSMVLLGVFAVIALLLAALGIYGVMSYAVTQRKRELGVRMALGAAKSDVLRLVVRQGMVLAAVGVLLGVAAALALTRLLGSQLYQVRATDPATFLAVAAALVGVALAANLVPALRATRLDPAITLHSDG